MSNQAIVACSILFVMINFIVTAVYFIWRAEFKQRASGDWCRVCRDYCGVKHDN